MYLLLANLVAVAHAGVIAILIGGLGALLVGTFAEYPRAWRTLFWLVAAAFLASQLAIQDCALTRLEKLLWELHQPGSAYRGSFMGTYLPFLCRAVNGYALHFVVATLLLRLWRRSHASRVGI